jgi:murein L,D-transpeptidase YafK
MGSKPDHAKPTRRGLIAGAFGCAALAGVAAGPARAQGASIADRGVSHLPVDLIVVDKRRRRLHLYYRDRMMKSYRVALGQNPVGHKRDRGDGRTPEGLYRIDYKKPESRFGLALHLDYPNERDRAQASARGADPGGAIYIHGQPKEASGIPFFRIKFAREDWTDGCIALTNAEMAEIYRSVREGTPVLVRP